MYTEFATLYINESSRECVSTRDRATFRTWIRAGFRVSVWRNGKHVVTFNDLGLYM